MRIGVSVMQFMLAAAVCGCGSSLGPGAGSGGTAGTSSGGTAGMSSGGGGWGGTSGSATFCSQALGDCSQLILSGPGSVCTLSDGIAFACGTAFVGALVRGAQYTYIQILNPDVAWVYAYDQNQKLIAALFWGGEIAIAGGDPWSCTAGPTDFDPREARSLLPAGSSELLCAR